MQKVLIDFGGIARTRKARNASQGAKSPFGEGVDLLHFSKAPLRRVAVEFCETLFFHTFFLPKRERKYQRKRFRAAARSPRGHRSCSALSALEMRHRLQRCNCSSQNEALAPLMWRKTYVFDCSHVVPPKTPEGKRTIFEVCSVEIPGALALPNFIHVILWFESAEYRSISCRNHLKRRSN